MSDQLDDFSTAAGIATAIGNKIHPLAGLIFSQASVPASMAQVMDDIANGTLSDGDVYILGLGVQPCSTSILNLTARTLSLLALGAGVAALGGAAVAGIGTAGIIAGGVAAVSILAGAMANPDIRDKLTDPVFWGDMRDYISNPKTISDVLGTTPDPLVKTTRYVDPLILDLDGDGLEITPLSKGILFDANGDTIKTSTAWAGADDGMLVWDRNGNGLIDSGQELFGDETILANGKKAAHGFAALGDLDKGSVINGVTVGASDGVFDANDPQYANLRIWRDLNQDGISQANELKTLAETGVTSIKLGSSATNTNYGDAILVQSGTFTRADGSSGQAAGSFILAHNNFVRQFTPITVSDAAKALPGLKRSGWVQNLCEVTSLNYARARQLEQFMAGFAVARYSTRSYKRNALRARRAGQ